MLPWDTTEGSPDLPCQWVFGSMNLFTVSNKNYFLNFLPMLADVWFSEKPVSRGDDGNTGCQRHMWVWRCRGTPVLLPLLSCPTHASGRRPCPPGRWVQNSPPQPVPNTQPGRTSEVPGAGNQTQDRVCLCPPMSWCWFQLCHLLPGRGWAGSLAFLGSAPHGESKEVTFKSIKSFWDLLKL